MIKYSTSPLPTDYSFAIFPLTSVKFPFNTQRQQYGVILINGSKKEFQMETKKFLETNENGNTTY